MPPRKIHLAFLKKEIVRLEALRWDAQRQSDAQSVSILQNEISALERERDQALAQAPKRRPAQQQAKFVMKSGDCFRWAAKEVARRPPSAVLIHGTVVSPDFPFLGRIAHAWVEDGDMVFDWQCIVAGRGGPYAHRGYPRGYFYASFSPEISAEYTDREALAMMVRHNHWGPWE